MSGPDAARVLRAALPPARRIATAVAFGVGSAAMSIALLGCSSWLIVRAADRPPLLVLSLAIVGVRAFALSRAACRYVERLSGHDASLRQLADIRTDRYAALVRAGPARASRLGRGDLLVRFVADVDDLQFVTMRVVQPLASAVTVLVGTVAVLVWLADAAALALGLCLGGGLLLAGLVQTVWTGRLERRFTTLRGDLLETVAAVLRTMPDLIAFEADGDAVRRCDAMAARLQRSAVQRAWLGGLIGAAVTVLAAVTAAATLLGMAPGFAAGRWDAATLAVFGLLPLAVAEVAGVIPLAVVSLRATRESAARVASAVPDVPEHVSRAARGASARSPARSVSVPLLRLRGVSAGWPDGPEVIRSVDLDVAPGERVFVTGPSGSGKSTLAYVLAGLLDYRGTYCLDGVEASALHPGALRARVGLVEQRPWLFDTTVRQNLMFARDTATEDDVWHVLERVRLADWTRSRGGLDAAVGEQGSLVSGGEAQRIALARALLADRPVVVLDEPTAHVDASLALTLLQDILAAGADRSVLLLGHHLPPGIAVDRIVTLPGAVS